MEHPMRLIGRVDMPRKATSREGSTTKKKDAPGVSLEKLVVRVQQMMDPNSTVSHNERLEDRIGNTRQYDVVIRGRFGGRPVLGVIECKDHNRKKGPTAVEAFAKKTENLGANLRLMVSKKGFTKQALDLAKHEHIGCLSLLPADPKQAGFSIGDMWYGVIRLWTNIGLVIHFAVSPAPIATFRNETVKWGGKQVINWFSKELLTTHGGETREGDYRLELKFKEPRNIEVEGKEYPVIGIDCRVTRICRTKKKWVSWSGDAFYDWHSQQLTMPANGTVVGSPVEADIATWPDYDGDIPDLRQGGAPRFVQAILHATEAWDNNGDSEVPDLGGLYLGAPGDVGDTQS
jgi:hypothetical protein